MPSQKTQQTQRRRGKDKKIEKFKKQGKFTSKHLRTQEMMREKRQDKTKKNV